MLGNTTPTVLQRQADKLLTPAQRQLLARTDIAALAALIQERT